MSDRAKSASKARLVCDYWNEHFPVGSAVSYRGKAARTRSAAFIVSGTPKIFLDGRSGLVALANVVGVSEGKCSA